MKKNLRPITFKLPQIDEHAQVTFVMVDKDTAQKLYANMTREILSTESKKESNNSVESTYGMWYNTNKGKYEIIKIDFNVDLNEAKIVEIKEVSNMRSRAKVQLKLALAKNGVV